MSDSQVYTIRFANQEYQHFQVFNAPHSSPEKEHRYRDAMEGYMEGVLGHDQEFAQGNIPSIEIFIKVRSSAGDIRLVIAIAE